MPSVHDGEPARSGAGSRRSPPVFALAIAVTAGLGVAEAQAAPGQALRLGGVEPQGPASRAVSALHHNPAMLAALRGTAVQVSFGTGLEQLRVRRHEVDAATGMPLGSLDRPQSIFNPKLAYFGGVSFFFDPVALGVGLYDLSSSYALQSAEPLRYHLAPDPDPGCVDASKKRCPPNGGAMTLRQDLTFAFAYGGGPFQLGVALHMPYVRERFSLDHDTMLGPADAAVTQCDTIEDPECAVRLGFKGWTHWIARDGAPPGFDVALTFGAGVELARGRVTLGARYRTFPLRRAGVIALGGVAMVCRPEGAGEAAGGVADLPPCSAGQTIGATLRERLPQEVAFGGSFVLGRNRWWRVDTNLYWLDLCAGGVRAASCPDDGSQSLRLVGLDRRSVVLPEFARFRGLQDLYGADVWARYRVRSNTSVVLGGHFASPAVRRSATSAADAQGYRVGVSIGARVRVRNSAVLLVPGYGFDLGLPRRISGSDAGFVPEAATRFEQAGGDLNAEGARAVLEGRARPTNAGRYFGALHTLTLTLLWGDDSAELD